jgi:hypothetical protein
MGSSSPAAELGDLVAGLLGAVVDAQATIDADAQARTDAWLNDPPGDVPVPPPLWFTVGSTALEVQLAARVSATLPGRPSLLVRTANPVDAALLGYEASTQMRLRVVMDARPRSALPAAPPAAPPTDPADPADPTRPRSALPADPDPTP